MAKVRAIIVGASGYSGAEAARILLGHPSVEVAGLFGSMKREAEAPLMADLFPRLRGLTALRVPAFEVGAALSLKPEVAILAAPAEVSAEIAPGLLGRGVKVVDISAAFRFKDAAVFERAYGFAHPNPRLCEAAAYGLPEINRAAVVEADLIACAGCYVTAALIPLAALARAGAIDWAWAPTIDAVSGVSGAGRAATQAVHFCEVSLQPYRVLEHKHAPEIESRLGGRVVFTPHLAAWERGILSTMHVSLAEGWTGARAREELERAYGRAPFVRVLPAGQWPSVAAVRHTNFCDVGLAADDGLRRLIVVSAIDNLVKGAAGQAVQCVNIRLGLPEAEGLR